MTEAELLQGLFSAISAVITIFSLFFTMVSGYLAALYQPQARYWYLNMKKAF